VCHRVETIGRDSVHADVSAVLAVHDQRTLCDAKVPLA
jgi:hypothetical protein